MYQQPLPRFDRRSILQGHVRSLINDQYRRSTCEVHRVGDTEGFGSWCDCVFCKSSRATPTHHSIADGEPVHGPSHGINYARDFRAWCKGERWLRLVFPLNLKDVEEVQGCSIVLN